MPSAVSPYSTEGGEHSQSLGEHLGRDFGNVLGELAEAARPDVEKVDTKTHAIKAENDYYKINLKGYVPALEITPDDVLTEGPAIGAVPAVFEPQE